MTLRTTTLRPGLLVNLSTSCRGNVKYDKIDLDEQHDGTQEKTKWETTRVIHDVDEHDRAVKAQSKARSIITSVCVNSSFTLLCRLDDKDRLEAAIRDAHRVVDEFNSTASLTTLRLYCYVAEIAQDDVTAVQNINREVRDLLSDMAAGVEKMDAKAIRAAASKAKEVGGMLSPDAQVRVQFAIDAARSAAKQIVRAGEAASVEIDTIAIRNITEQRTAFLDLRDEVEIERPVIQGRAIDFEPEVTDEMLAAFSGPLPAKRG